MKARFGSFKQGKVWFLHQKKDSQRKLGLFLESAINQRILDIGIKLKQTSPLHKWMRYFQENCQVPKLKIHARSVVAVTFLRTSLGTERWL